MTKDQHNICSPVWTAPISSRPGTAARRAARSPRRSPAGGSCRGPRRHRRTSLETSLFQGRGPGGQQIEVGNTVPLIQRDNVRRLAAMELPGYFPAVYRQNLQPLHRSAESLLRARGHESHHDEEPSDGQPALSDAPVGVRKGVLTQKKHETMVLLLE